MQSKQARTAVARRAKIRPNARFSTLRPQAGLSARPTPIQQRGDHRQIGHRARNAVDGTMGSALGFRYLTSYIARSLLESGGFRPQLHPRS